MFWNDHCILLQESSAATPLVWSERRHFVWNSSGDNVQRSTTKDFETSRACSGLLEECWHREARDGYAILWFTQTGIGYFCHIKRKVSFSSPALFFVGYENTVIIPPTCWKLFPFFAFPVSENPKIKKKLSKTCIATYSSNCIGQTA